MNVKARPRTIFSRLEISFPEIDFINSFTAISRTFASALEEARIMSISSRLLGCPDAGPIFIKMFNMISLYAGRMLPWTVK